jgi:hypothetical protein
LTLFFTLGDDCPITLATTDAVYSIETLRAAIAASRERLLAHPIYEAVDTLPRLRTFMAEHVFAVWDFMCLAKRLQRDLTSVDGLWLPPLRPSLARFINSIVLAEESDVDPDGRAASHFHLYLAAMDEVGADAEPARRFVASLREGQPLDVCLRRADASLAARTFVTATLRTAREGTTIEVLSSFLFGREDLIPEMFARLRPQWGQSGAAPRFAYYVERHIELDGDDHGPAGLRSLAEIAGTDAGSWQAAADAAVSAIDARTAFWDGVHAANVAGNPS